MPTITLLNLTMSRDTKGVITARVDYTLRFSLTEVTANIAFAERVALVRRVDSTDKYTVEVPGVPPRATQAAGDRRDRPVAILADATVSADALGVAPGAAGEVPRSFTRVLTAAELSILLEVGLEHPYAVVSVSPTEITSDIQIAPVEIDVGEPVPAVGFNVGGDPVGLAVDGVYVYVATKEGAVTKLDRDGNIIASFPIGEELSAIGFDGANLWVTAVNSTVTKLDRNGTILGAFPTGGIGPVAIAFGPLTVWIVNYGSSTVSMLNRDGLSLGIRTVGNGPWSVATTPEGATLVVSFGAGVVAMFSSDGTVLGNTPVGSNPWSIAVADGQAWVTSFGDERVSVINVADGATSTFDVGSGPKGIAAGAGAVWIASSLSNELIKVRTDDRAVVATYPVGAGPDAVAFDGDRVFVANRTSRDVSLIRLV